MTKIKNFRITLRPREMARWLKKEHGVNIAPEVELAIEQLVKDSRRWIEPASVYTTLTRPIAEKTTTIAFPEMAVAVSLIAASIGPAAERERSTVSEGDQRGLLLAALQQEALSQTLQFAIRLIQDQAKEEECELSAPVFLQAVTPAEAGAQNTDALGSGFRRNDGMSSLASLVGAQRIGIDLTASGPGLPGHALMAWLFWTPVGKAVSRRPEKAVA